MTMKEISITENEANQRLDKYLKKRLPEASTGFLYKMLRKKNITLNGAKASGSEKLAVSDTVTFFFSDETFSKLAGVSEGDVSKAASWKTDRRYTEPDILFEDEHILAINKPAGLLSQKAAPDDFSANEQLLRFLYERGDVTDESLQTFRPSVANRLDRNTSGILLAGKTLHGSQTLSDALKNRTIQKTYHAIVHGQFSEARTFHAWLLKDENTNQVTIFSEEKDNAKHIQTGYRPLEVHPNHTLLEIDLITGKSHQIRAHLAFLGFPIVFDPKYGDREKDRALRAKWRFQKVSRQMLHATSVTFADGRELTAPSPSDFAETLEAIREIG